jgi:hypothetical protein
MRRALFAIVLASLALGVHAIPQATSQESPPQANATTPRKTPCKTPENASLCYWTRGRLRLYTIGRPTYRIWKVGTNRILGIYAGPSVYPPRSEEDYLIDFPPNLERAYRLEEEQNVRLRVDAPWLIGDVFADFEVCPLEPDTPGDMQASCIESAKNIFVEGSKRGYQ